jgi:hypothetical protein
VGTLSRALRALFEGLGAEIERELGRLGVDVHRTIMLSDWTCFILFLSALARGRITRHIALQCPKLDGILAGMGGTGW